MGFLHFSIVLPLFASLNPALAFAVPGPVPDVAAELKTGTMRVPVAWNMEHQPNGTRALLKAYRKHHPSHYSVHYEESQKLFRQQYEGVGKSSVIAKPEFGDSEYLSPMTVGGQQFMADFDTGSADL
jgi:hypothetical protein